MIINKLSSSYRIRELNNNDLDIIFNLCKENNLYYKYCPPKVSKESILEDLKALPPNKTLNDKYYLGYFKDDELICVLDLIDAYPNKDTLWIGFFMMNVNYQNKNIGTNIVSELCLNVKERYKYIMLAWVKGNKQSESFWIKNGFKTTGKQKDLGDFIVVEAIKTL